MRNIDRVSIRKHIEAIPDIPQLLEPRHLVIRVVDKGLVKPRQPGPQLHHAVGVLRVRLPAGNGRELPRGVEPVFGIIVVEPLARSERVAAARRNAGAQLLLRFRVVDAVEVGALLEGRAGDHFDFVRWNDHDEVIVGEIGGGQIEQGIVGGR